MVYLNHLVAFLSHDLGGLVLSEEDKDPGAGFDIP